MRRLLAAALARCPVSRCCEAGRDESGILRRVGTGLTPREFADRGIAKGVRIGVEGPASLRAVTHLDVGPAAVQEAIEIIRRDI